MARAPSFRGMYISFAFTNKPLLVLEVPSDLLLLLLDSCYGPYHIFLQHLYESTLENVSSADLRLRAVLPHPNNWFVFVGSILNSDTHPFSLLTMVTRTFQAKIVAHLHSTV